MKELYKRFRPKTLDEVVGCEEARDTLKGFLENDSVPHTILFSGPSGCGKTTLARILRKSLECHDLDFQEYNSASFNGVQTIRDIQGKVRSNPAAGKCRVWLLDEVHQLTKDAQNAALKIFEDTPPHVYFFLCTTEPEKLIKPIITRCQPIPVSLATDANLETLLHWVCTKEKAKIQVEVKDELIRCALGSPRMLLVLLEKILALPEKKRLAAVEAKAAETNEAIDLCRALIAKKSWIEVGKILTNLKAEPEATRHAVMGYARSVLLNPRGKDAAFNAYTIIIAFENNFYDSKAAGLARAAYEVCHTKD